MSIHAPLVAWIEGIGLRGPGLAGWRPSIDVLAGRQPYVGEATILVAPSALPPAERRRVGKGVKIALEVGFEAVAHAGRDAATLPSIFTSSSGDGDNCDAICRELAGDRMISPTRFHNSVHNAPAGYWGIASGSMASSTSLCAYDDSFVAGLDDALSQLVDEAAVLLIAYDAPYPEPLRKARPTPDSFAIALLLTREPSARALAKIELDVLSSSAIPATRVDDPALEACRMDIPAARSLPLLVALASDSTSDHELVFDAGNGTRLRLRVTANPARPHLQSRLSACA
jgi:hypothetical protein